MKYAYIHGERRNHSISRLCRVLRVSEQGYYQWRRRPVSRRAERDKELLSQIRTIHAESKQSYGRIRIERELRESGIRTSQKRVARLMNQGKLRAKAARKFRVTTRSAHGREVAPNLLERNFHADAPNKVWVGDITYLWTKEGWMYLSVFLDLYSRTVVGWALSRRLTTDAVVLSLQKAIARRRPQPGLIVHTDRGVQYTAKALTRELNAIDAKQSMSRRGDCWDNAVAESFFHSLKVEAIYGETFETRRKMEYEVFDYIERFYNRKRRHSAVGYLAPIEFETKQKAISSMAS